MKELTPFDEMLLEANSQIALGEVNLYNYFLSLRAASLTAGLSYQMALEAARHASAHVELAAAELAKLRRFAALRHAQGRRVRRARS